jgi:hypothetical protein
MLIGLAGGALVSYHVTGSTLPTNSKDALIFQNGLLLIVLGCALIEYKFTKPADSVVNSLAGMMTLVGVYYIAPSFAWWAVFVYCAAVFLVGTICVAVSAGPNLSAWQRTVAEVTYRPAVFFGRARLLYSILFLFALFAFRSLQSEGTVELLLFWGLFVVLWPLGIPELLSTWHRRQDISRVHSGRVIQTDWPNIVRVALQPGSKWNHSALKVFRQPDGSDTVVVPLYTQPHEDIVIGTGICIGPCRHEQEGMQTSLVYDAPPDEQLTQPELALALGARPGSSLVGFVVEDSDISQIRFETWDPNACYEGMLVFAILGGEPVYYQIINGSTKEELLQANRHGFQVATAGQVGKLHETRGFIKHPWLPLMNAPVFAISGEALSDESLAGDGDFVYGVIPQTKIRVSGQLADAIDHHIAILGVTGSGKTELAFDLIRHSVGQGVKVVCVDLTARYGQRLSDLTPFSLSISAASSEELSKRLFDAETGNYGAGAEKKILNDYTEKLRLEVAASVKTFMDSDDEVHRLGLITLGEISNSKATLAITEIYLSTLLQFAKDRGSAAQRILIVLEEAHTVIPESSTMGVGDFESKGMVARIAQIALQGRKYGVGLMILAQRTATVSKTILTQCNTIISFACVDETSLGFLTNVFGRVHTNLIPTLPPLHAVVFGKGIRSERPLIVEIPFSDEKKRESDLADGRVARVQGKKIAV